MTKEITPSVAEGTVVEHNFGYGRRSGRTYQYTVKHVKQGKARHSRYKLEGTRSSTICYVSEADLLQNYRVIADVDNAASASDKEQN